MCDISEEVRIPLMSRSGHALHEARPVGTGFPAVKLQDEKDIGYKLDRRKVVMIRRQNIVNAEFIFALIGLIMMLVNTELFIQKVDPDEHFALHFIIKFVMSSTTVMLLVAVVMYHKTEIKLMILDKNVDNWRMVVTYVFLLKVSFELLVCAIHPIPGNIMMSYLSIEGKRAYVPIDVVLSILMLLRLYIVLKFIAMHNKWILSTSMVSFGALNEVKVDTEYFLKCLMRDHPAALVGSIMLAIFIINSWAMRTCESYFVPDNDQSSFFNSMWLVAITFLTVGYGDLSPNSYCGRVIAAETGVMGVATTALLVTVITSKFQQSRSERYVHTFMARVKLDKKKKNAAAKVVTVTVVLWYLKRHDQLTSNRNTILLRKLRKAVKKIRQVERSLAIIHENALGIVEVSNEMDTIVNVVEFMQAELGNMVKKSRLLDTFLKKIDSDLSKIQGTASTDSSVGYH